LSKTVPDAIIPDHIEMELIKYGHKEPVVQAPVYEEGDWWVFRVKVDEKPPEGYRITYKDGEFQGDDPLILNSPPLASVCSNHPDIKNFDFPLVPGKKWTYRYSRDEYGFLMLIYSGPGPEEFGNAEVEVLGPLAKPVETPAGQFEVVEIRRNTFSQMGKAEADPAIEIVYFYSPGTKSVVKLTAKLSKTVPDAIIPDHIEMELIKYGHKEPVVQAPVYEEGDWWVFRVNRSDRPSEKYRITYKNGEFLGDDPLMVADESPPLASVNSKHSEVKNFMFPLIPGKKWKFRYSRAHYGLEPTLPSNTGYNWSLEDSLATAEVEVTGTITESIETPAGAFKSIKLRRIETDPRVEMIFYYSSVTKSVVKLTAILPDARAVGAPVDHIEMELIKYGHQDPDNLSKVSTDVTVPAHKEKKIIKLGDQASNIKAPAYNDGDWWVFRVKVDEKPPEEYRITYKDGEFQGDDPLILTENPPLASVYSNHPDIKNFNFPLVPGKKWRFRYLRSEYGFFIASGGPGEAIGTAEVEVIGPRAEPIDTPAGKFEVVEIQRISSSKISTYGNDPTIEIVYFYSPATMSVVKLTAKISKVSTDPTIADHIEMELVEYGRKATVSEQPFVKAPVIK